MGIKLYVEVLDHAPAELTSNERLLLLVLAEKANDQTRKAVWPNPDRLLHRLGMSEDGLRKVCQKLAARGYEVRIPVGTNKAGSPVYAYKGRAVDYRVPVFPRRELPPERRDNSTALGDAKAGQLSVKAGQMYRPFPQFPQRSLISLNARATKSTGSPPTPARREKRSKL